MFFKVAEWAFKQPCIRIVFKRLQVIPVHTPLMVRMSAVEDSQFLIILVKVCEILILHLHREDYLLRVERRVQIKTLGAEQASFIFEQGTGPITHVDSAVETAVLGNDLAASVLVQNKLRE